MARPLRITYPGAFYYVTSRGNEWKDVFTSKRDREKFLEYFESATKRYDAVIHVFCLDDNLGKLGLSARAYNRVLKIARTLADLAGVDKIWVDQIAEAIQDRTLGRGSNR